MSIMFKRLVVMAAILSVCHTVSPTLASSGSDGSPDESLLRLQEGNARFVGGRSTHPNTNRSRIADTFLNGQHPFATVIACSDSRVPVERLFDQGVGDLFVIRVAGNVCATDEIGSIEYGVDHLGTPLMVVLGHSDCGAVTAVATEAELHGSIPSLVDNIQPAVAEARRLHPGLHGKELVPEAVKVNVWQSIDDLFKSSPATRKRVAEGKLRVVGAVYDISTGSVEWLGQHVEQSRLLAYTDEPSHDVGLVQGHDDKAYKDYARGAAEAKRSPSAAIAFLKKGNERFVSGRSIRPHIGSDRLMQASSENQGDHAYATVITCSDSRVPVEELFDAGVMDIFVIRVAGNVCDTDEIGSIEYGLAHVHTPVLVVLGHKQCGAVTAVTHALHGSGHALERNIPPLVDNIQPAVKRAMAQHPGIHGDGIIPYAIEENVWQGIEDLFMKSPAARELVHSGKTKVVGAIYDVGTGRVEWFPESKPAAILAQVEADPRRAVNAMADSGHGDHTGRPEDAHGTVHTSPDQHAEAIVEPVTLIDRGTLKKLDEARHRTVQAADVSLPMPDAGMSTIWIMILGVAVLGTGGWLLMRSGALGRTGIAQKMYGSFAAVVALGVLGGWFGYHTLNSVSAEEKKAYDSLDLKAMTHEWEALQGEFILIGIEDRAHGESILADHRALSEEYREELAAMQSQELDETERDALSAISEANKAYDASFGDIVKRYHEIERLKEELETAGEMVSERLEEVLHEHERSLAEMESSGAGMEKISSQTRLVEGLAECELLAARVSQDEIGFLLDKDVARIDSMEHNLGALYGGLRSVEEMIRQIAGGNEEAEAELAILASVEVKAKEYARLLTAVVKDELAVEGELVDCTERLGKVAGTATALAARAEAVASLEKVESHRASIALMIIVAVVGSLFAVFITRGITIPVNAIIAGLREGAEQVNEAAGQVATASQDLAEGASEQASSLEETSSALEEMAAMTRTNAANAKKANELSEQAKDAAQTGDQTMDKLNAAMVAINASSGEISKIIKVIEEIAFQTNLLALNAAVEAARAGEHGKGFAVVADEVRNLAQRAAQAAKETTSLIGDSVAKAKEGADVAGGVAEALGAIVKDVNEVSDLISGISQASSEQAQGVEQVNMAVSQMDKVTQTSASGAEESASAAEELSAQAQTVRQIVRELLVLVKGGAAESEDVQTSRPSITGGRDRVSVVKGARTGSSVAGGGKRTSVISAAGRQDESRSRRANIDEQLEVF